MSFIRSGIPESTMMRVRQRNHSVIDTLTIVCPYLEGCVQFWSPLSSAALGRATKTTEGMKQLFSADTKAKTLQFGKEKAER